MKRKITLKQIARELDVSISTVSKALRNSEEISADTIEKVQAFAKLYNYKPNNIALSLKNRRTKKIGVIIPEIVHHFFSNVIKGIEKVANKHGYNVIVALSNESFDKEVLNMEMLANGSIDGFILSISKETLMLKDYHHFRETINQGMPIVMFDRVVNEINCDKVIVDDFDGAKNAVKIMIDGGSKHIGIITTKDYVSVGSLRTNGYLSALQLSGITASDELVLKVEDGLDTEENSDKLYKTIQSLFDNNPQMDGVFAVNELFALIAMKVAHERGIKIPEQMQVIGFTNGVLSKYATPSLTTVSQHAQQIGEQSAYLLIERLEKDEDLEEDGWKTVIVKTDVVERDSTK
ncbi:LacI family transcriptional regulator [Paucihalobacter ruber]|uniref:LacI family transcriptional regulator n=1 Tax=Paucihalobacter ruber TaxID=2567861 RepID=A0A506PE39_9FLAO|nr:LacI family DNA-binding transcriptional regulator [Paucihalobacter ruber]TPV31849.1 LacI family transcriptional regulator [Paucihalobacter ruber]